MVNHLSVSYGVTLTAELSLIHTRGFSPTDQTQQLSVRARGRHGNPLRRVFVCVVPQVMYSQDRHGQPSVVKTNSTSLELSLPVNQDYVIQIKPFSEGGEGLSSRQITIPRIAGLTSLPVPSLAVMSLPFKDAKSTHVIHSSRSTDTHV